MSKAIFGAAITGILGASVATYKNFGGNAFPLEGQWNFHLKQKMDGNLGCAWYGEIMIVNSGNHYIGLAGDNRDSNGDPDTCLYGVKNLRSIEWNDQDSTFTFLIDYFPKSQTHPGNKVAPADPLHFKLRRNGDDDWISEEPNENSDTATFSLTLHREGP